MNYKKIYDAIIEKAKLDNRIKGVVYYESHHIVPKSLGGSNCKENRVLLTAKEHFVCHRLLVKIYKNDSKKYLSMLNALHMMRASHSLHQRVTNARVFAQVKAILYGPEGLRNGTNHQCFGRKNSKETIQLMSAKRIAYCKRPEERERLRKMGANKTSEHRRKIIESITGQKRTTEQRLNMSLAHKRNPQLNERNGMSKSVSIHGVIYPSLAEAQRQIEERNLGYKLKSDKQKYAAYFYLNQPKA